MKSWLCVIRDFRALMTSSFLTIYDFQQFVTFKHSWLVVVYYGVVDIPDLWAINQGPTLSQIVIAEIRRAIFMFEIINSFNHFKIQSFSHLDFLNFLFWWKRLFPRRRVNGRAAKSQRFWECLWIENLSADWNHELWPNSDQYTMM